MREEKPRIRADEHRPGVRTHLWLLPLLLLCLGTAVAGPGGPAAHEPGAHHSTGEVIAAWLAGRGLSPEAVVLVIATLPVVELRGAVPVGINFFRLPWYRVVLLAIAGNILPVFIILLFLDRAVRFLVRFRLFRRFFDWLFARTRRRSELVRRWEFWGLALFVSVPLPVTGAWTGSMAAVLMGLPYWRSVLAILIGVVVAGAVVTALSLLGTWGAVIAGAALLALLLNGLLSGLRRRGRKSPGT